MTALRRGWDVADAADQRRADLAAQRRRAADEARPDQAATDENERRRRVAGWAAAISAALDDDQLTTAVARLSPPVPGLDRRSAHVARGDLAHPDDVVLDDDPNTLRHIRQHLSEAQP